MAEKEYTWDDLEAAIGQDFSGGVERTGIEPVEWSTIRRYCEPLELDCPIHYDEETAKSLGYRGVVAPISSVSSTFASQGVWRPGDLTRWPEKDAHGLAKRYESENVALPRVPAPPTTAAFVTDIEVEYFEPVCVGDRLTSKGRKLVSVVMRETSVGYGSFTVFESEIYNQRGELVAKLRNGGYQYNPHPPEKLEEIRKQREAQAR